MSITKVKQWTVAIAILVGVVMVLSLFAGKTDAERIQEANAAAATGPGASEQFTGKISAFDLRDGDCFNAALVSESEKVDFGDVELVPCTGSWVYQAKNSFLVNRDGDFPGYDYFTSEGDRRCHLSSVVYLHPTLESWNLGDRVVSCLAQNDNVMAVKTTYIQ